MVSSIAFGVGRGGNDNHQVKDGKNFKGHGYSQRANRIPDTPAFPSVILRPGERYLRRARYRFAATPPG